MGLMHRPPPMDGPEGNVLDYLRTSALYHKYFRNTKKLEVADGKNGGS